MAEQENESARKHWSKMRDKLSGRVRKLDYHNVLTDTPDQA